MHRFIQAAPRLGAQVRKGMQYAAMRRHRLTVVVSTTALIILSAATSNGAADRFPLVVVNTAQTDTVLELSLIHI